MADLAEMLLTQIAQNLNGRRMTVPILSDFAQPMMWDREVGGANTLTVPNNPVPINPAPEKRPKPIVLIVDREHS